MLLAVGGSCFYSLGRRSKATMASGVDPPFGASSNKVRKSIRDFISVGICEREDETVARGWGCLTCTCTHVTTMLWTGRGSIPRPLESQGKQI